MKKVVVTDTQILEQITSAEQLIFPDPWSAKALESTVAQPHGHIWTREENNQVIAYLIFYTMGDEVEIARIAVLPAHRGKGYGKKLLDELFEYAKENNTIQILLEVRGNNEVAISLYENKGFEKIGIRKDYYATPLEDAVVMNYSLNVNNVRTFR